MKLRLLVLGALLSFLGVDVHAQVVTLGTYTGSSANNVLFASGTGANNTSQNISIYTAAEIYAAGGLPGIIDKLWWYKEGGDYALSTSLGVWIKHTTRENWASYGGDVNWGTEVSGATPVYNNASWFIPNGTGWKDISFSAPFTWNGIDNIAIYTSFSRPGTAPVTDIKWGRTTANMTNAARVGSGSVGDLLRNSNRPLVQLRMWNTLLNNAALTPAWQTLCGGPNTMDVRIQNTGKNKITEAVVEWTLNRVTGATLYLTNLDLDTLNGQGNNDTIITLTNLNIHPTAFDTLKAWIASTNAGNDGFRLNDTFTQTLRGAMSGTYTIGGAGANFATWAAAFTALDTLGVCGPVRFNIAAGTYTERVTLKAIKGSSATNTITFAGAGKAATKITNAATGTADWHTIFLDGSDYIIMRDLTIESTTQTHGVGLMLGNVADHNRFINIRVQMNISSTQVNTSGILFTNEYDSYAGYGNTGNYNSFDSIEVDGAYYGIRFNGTSTSFHSIGNSVTNSILTNQQTYGIYNQYHSNFLFDNNQVSGMRSTTGYAIQNPDVANFTITNNRINGTGYGIRVVDANAELYNPAVRSLIANNIVFTTTSTSGYALEVSSSKYVHVLHNTVVSNSSGNYATAYFYDNQHIDFRNNILVNNNGGASSYVVSASSTALFDSLDYNNYYTLGSALVYESATKSYTNLGAWQAAFPLHNQHAYSINPQFISASNVGLVPASPSFYGAYAGVERDIDGVLRSAVSPTAGAKEKAAQPLNASVVELVNPAGFFCKGNYDVKVKVRNKGTTALTNINILWELNGVLQAPLAITGLLDTLGSATGNDSVITLANLPFAAGIKQKIKVWIQDVNGAADPVKGDDTLYTEPAASLSDVITVGGSSPDFATLTDAVSALTDLGMCGPVTFDIRPGTYTGKLVIGKIKGSSAINTITFKGSGRNNTIVTDNGAFGTFSLRGASYITLRDMTVAATAATEACGILLTDSSNYNHFANLNILVDSSSTATSIAGIALSASATSISSGMGGNYNEFDSLKISGGYYAIYMQGTTTNSVYIYNNNVRNSVFVNQYYYGIYAGYLVNHVFERNHMSKFRNALNTGISTSSSANFIIKENVIIANTGIFPGSANKTNYNGVRSQIINNMIVAGTSQGLYLTTTDSADVFHNTVVASGTGNTNVPLFIGTNTNARGLIIRNNIIVNSNIAPTAYAVNIAATSTPQALDNNIYFAAGGVLVYESATVTYADLAAWKAAKPTYNLSSYSTEPAFVSPSDLHLKPLGTILYGANVGVTKDIDGTTRSNPPVIGAHERFPYLNSAAVSEILPHGFCAGTQNVLAKITNIGTNKINSLTVNWELDGVLKTPVTISLPIDTFGSVPGAEQIVTLGSHSFTMGVAVNVKVWVSLPNGQNDPYRADDTLAQVLKTGLSGFYMIGSGFADYNTVAAAVYDLNYFGICGPVTFNIQNGSYTEQLKIGSFFTSDPSYDVTFQSQNADSSLVNINWPVSLSANGNYLVNIDGARNINFKHLSFERTGTADFSRIIVLNSTSKIRFSNNRFIAPAAIATDGDANRASIYSSDAFSEDSTWVENNLFNQNSNAITLFGNVNNRSKYTVIRNNVCLSSYLGIWLKHNSSPKVNRNLVYKGNSADADFYGISLENCDSAADVSYNRIVFDRGQAIRFLGCKGYNNAKITVYNNTASGLSTTSGSQAISIESNNTYNSQYINVAHNTFRVSSTHATTGRTVNMAGTATSQNANINIVNNILVNRGAGYVYYVPANAFSASVAINYNTVYAAGANIGVWNSTTGIANDGLRSWVSQSNRDSLSANLHISFANDSTLEPGASTANNFNFATPLTAYVSDDINGNVRTGTYFYKGAHELTQLYAPSDGDAGVWEIQNPVAGVILAGEHDLVFRVRNNGLIPVSTFNYNYSINDVPYSAPGMGSQTLNAGRHTLITIPDVSIPAGNIVLKIWTMNVNGTSAADLNPLNDTMVVYLTSSDPLSGNYKVGTGERFVNLTAVADSLRNKLLGGDVFFELTSTYTSSGEVFPIVFSSPSTGNYKVTIRPATGVTARVTSGDPGSTNPLINLDGVINLTFDGRPGGVGNTSQWIIRNTRTATTVGSVIRLINGASNNQLKYLQVEGQLSSTSYALIHFSTSASVPGGNSNNLVAYNTLRDRSDVGTAATLNQCIYSSGTGTSANENNTILGNRMFNFTAAGVNIGGGNGNNWIVDSNHFYNNRTTAPNVACTPISITGMSASTGYRVHANYIGGSNINAGGASWKNSGNVVFIAIELLTYNTVQVDNNVITNIEMTNTGTTASLRGIDFGRTGAKARIYKNTISNLVVKSRKTTFDGTGLYALNGIVVRTGDSVWVNDNTIHSLDASDNAGTAAVTVAGITVTNHSYAMLSNNKIYNLLNRVQNSARVVGILSANVPSGAVHHIVNNTVSLDANVITGLTGIMHGGATAAQSGKVNVQNNSVYIGGTPLSGTSECYGIYRELSTPFTANNNLVYYERTSPGAAFFDNGSSALTSNYNFYVHSGNAFKTSTGFVNFDSWKSAGNDGFGYLAAPSQLTASSLFANAAAGNLAVLTSNNSSWAVNGKGISSALVSSDINGNARPVVAGTPVDIGAYEFTPDVNVEPAAVSITPGAAPSVSVLSVYNRPVATVSWRSGTVPTALNLKYYSGVNAPGAGIGNNINSYYSIEATGGSGYLYDITLGYTPAELGSVTASNLTIAKKDGASAWVHRAKSLVNTSSFTVKDTVLGSFSLFTLTDKSNPLPVKLASFNALKVNKDVLVSWTTASEVNVSHFIVEASANGKEFEPLGQVSAKGNSATTLTYRFNHENAQRAMNGAPAVYYRLTSVDKNGDRQTFKTVMVHFDADVNTLDAVVAYPNPFNKMVSLSIPAIENTTAEITLTDLQGRAVKQHTMNLQAGNNEVSITELEELQAGVYFVKVTTTAEAKVIKLIKH